MSGLDDESTIRLSAFLGVLAVMAAWELAAPNRRHDIPRLIRWTNNLALVVVDTALLRLVFPVLATGAAIWAGAQGVGLFNWLGPPLWLALPLAVLMLDFAIWGQHVAMHKVPALWRLHRMHHADPEMDVTTALRFHPLEILVSMAIKIVLVVALGLPPVAVLLFEVILNATALFTHSNVALPAGLERVLRRVIVTPEMHRIHHSDRRDETDSNYGFALSIWDHAFGTHRAQAAGPIRFGIGIYGGRRDQWLDRLIWQPVRRR
jgi:sterol desaturase/sphingolipid hydroxylase (fatty acid hydroxylase superfamily)